MLIRGKCHCGNISFSLAWEPDPKEIPARACSCSFCVKHGGVWTSNPRGALEVAVQNPSRVSKYAFGTSFDGEGTDSRLARRKRNWIPDVKVMEG